jgi:hypothetical protein
MYIINVPYFDEENNIVRSDNQFFEDLPTLTEVLKKFYIDDRYSYIDEKYEDFSVENLLKIAVTHYKIAAISILVLNDSGKHQTSVWRVEDEYNRVRRSRKVLQYLAGQSEIILSTHARYEGEMHWDDIHFVYNGEERFLFAYNTCELEECDRKETLELEMEEERKQFSYIKLETGITQHVILSGITIDKPLKSENEIIGVFEVWAQKEGIVLTGKSYCLANPEDFTSQPFIQGLIEQDEQDPDHIFSTPSYLMFGFLGGNIPPLDELIEKLKKEKPGTIACVIDEFKDESLVHILDGLDHELRNQVIDLLPQIPCTSYKQRKRFADIFVYSTEYMQNRITKLLPRYELAKQKEEKRISEYDKDVLAEFQLWKEEMQKRRS